MKNFIIVSSALVGILLMGPLVREATANPPMNGTWSGTANCTGVVGGSPVGLEDDQITLAILTTANPMNLSLNITLATSNLNGDLNGGPHLYQGNTKGYGQLGQIEQCGTVFGKKRSFTGVIGDVKVLRKNKVPSPYLRGKLLASDQLAGDSLACAFDHVLQIDPTAPVIGTCPP